MFHAQTVKNKSMGNQRPRENDKNSNKDVWAQFSRKLRLNYQAENLKKAYKHMQNVLKSIDDENNKKNRRKYNEEDNMKNKYSMKKVTYGNLSKPTKRKSSQTKIKSNPLLLNNTQSPRRSISVQSPKQNTLLSPNNKGKISPSKYQFLRSPVKTEVEKAKRREKIYNLWVSYMNFLRRSKQRIKLFRYSRYCQFQNKWKLLANKMIHRSILNSLFIIKFETIKLSVTIINQILGENHLAQIPESIANKVLRRLKDADIPTILSAIVRQLKYRSSNLNSISIPMMTDEASETISPDRMVGIVNAILHDSLCQFGSNDVDDETVLDLIPVKEFNDVIQPFGKFDLSILGQLQRRDIRLIVNDRVVNGLVYSALRNVKFPIISNTIDEKALEEITKVVTIDEAVPIISKTDSLLDFINNMTPIDTKLYINKRIIGNIVNSVIEANPMPIIPNVVSDDIVKEILQCNKVDEIEYLGNRDVSSLYAFEPIDIRLYTSDTIIDGIINDLYGQTQVPIILNVPSPEVCFEIVENDIFDDVDDFSTLSIERLVNLDQPDLKLYVNDRITDDIVDNFLSELSNKELPITPNSFSDKDVIEIVNIPIEDSMSQLDTGLSTHLLNYQRKDDQFYVNSKFISGVIDDIYDEFDLPIIPNIVTQKAIDEILEEDFSDISDLFSKPDVSKLMEIDPYNRRISIDRSVLHRKLKKIYQGICKTFPIIPNICDDETAAQIARFDPIDDCFSNLPEKHVKSLFDYVQNDDKCYVNHNNVDEVLDNIYNYIPIPIVDNVPDNEAISEIAKMSVEDTFSQLPVGFPESISNFQARDIVFYVNSRYVENVFDDIYQSFKLPLCPNAVTDEDIEKILEDNHFDDVVPEFGELDPYFLTILDPFERRINFNFPINEYDIFQETQRQLPISPNVVKDEDISSIMSAFHSIDQMNEYSFALNDARPLQEYHAPKEVFEYLDDVVDNVMKKILQNEGLTNLPIEQQVYIEDETAIAILDGTINPPLIFRPMAKPEIEPLAKFELAERPFILTPDDILEGLLWNDVLPKMPIIGKRRKIVDFRDVVDEIVLDNYANSRSNHNSSESLNNSSDYVDLNSPYLMTSPNKSSSPGVSTGRTPSLLDTSSSIEENANIPMESDGTFDAQSLHHDQLAQLEINDDNAPFNDDETDLITSEELSDDLDGNRNESSNPY